MQRSRYGWKPGPNQLWIKPEPLQTRKCLWKTLCTSRLKLSQACIRIFFFFFSSHLFCILLDMHSFCRLTIQHRRLAHQLFPTAVRWHMQQAEKYAFRFAISRQQSSCGHWASIRHDHQAMQLIVWRISPMLSALVSSMP